MKNYTCKLKGTKKNNTSNLVVAIKADNKSQAYAMAYSFFERGETKTVFGRPEVGFTTFADYIVDAANYEHLAGKYFVPSTCISCN